MALRRRALAALMSALAAGACGQKGPPLPPLIHIPGVVEGLTARRVGDDVYLSVPVPAANIDGSVPADVSRIEVYAATSTAAVPRARFLEIATLVDTVTLAARDPRAPATAAPAAGRPARAPASAPTASVRRGARDMLTPEAITPRTLRSLAERALPARPAPGATSVGESAPTPQRYYMAVPFNDRGQSGPPSAPVAIPLAPAPDAPADLRLSYSATEVRVDWEPSGGVVGFLLESALPVETLDDLPVAAGAPTPLGRTTYNLYRELAPDPLALPSAPATPVGADEAPTPLNSMPLTTLSLIDDLQFDRERCYQIRAVRGAGQDRVEGRPSVRRCITPQDTFPPARPSGLSAVAASGTISLIWEPSPDFDTVGYLVLRGSGPDATLQPITPDAVTDTTFTDRNVTSGVRYVYAVVAVDARVPVANVSPESSRIEETAR